PGLGPGCEGYREPGREALPKDPGDPEPARRLAQLDRAAGVALELVVAAFAQVTRDRQEPLRDAVGVGEGVPEVSLAGPVAARHLEAAGRATVQLEGGHGSDGQPEGGEDVIHDLSVFRATYISK